MAAIGKGKGKLAGNNHLGADAVYYTDSSGGASGAKDSSGTVGNNEIWMNETDHGVWSDGEGVVEMKDQVGGDLVEGERKAAVECTICKDDITDHERNPCVRAPCCKAIAHKGCVEEWLRRESRCFVCPNVITTRHGRASYFAHTLTAEDLAVESEQKVQRKLADPGDLKEEFQKAREKFFAGNRVSDEKAFNELLAIENLDGRVPFADFVAQQEKVLAQVLAKNSMQATEAKDEYLARQLEEEWKSLASVAADEALARKLEEEEKAEEAAAALKAKKEVEENERVARELAERLEKEARAEEEKEATESEVEFEEDRPEQKTGARGEEGELRGRSGFPASEGLAAKVGKGRDGSAGQSDHSGRRNESYGRGVMGATAGERGLGGGKASSERSCGSDNGTVDEDEEGNLEDDDNDEEWVEKKKRKTTSYGGTSKRRMSMSGENVGGSRRRARSNSSGSKSGRRGSSSRQHTADAGAGVVAGTKDGEGKALPACSPRRAMGQSKGGRVAAKDGLGQIAMSDEEDEDSDDTGRLNLSVPLSRTTENASPAARARRAEAARMAAAEAEADSTRETALAAAAIAEAVASKGHRGGSPAGAGEAAARGSDVSGAAAVRYATSTVRGERSSCGRLPAASKRSSSGRRNINARLGTTAEEDSRKETNTIDLSRTD